MKHIVRGIAAMLLLTGSLLGAEPKAGQTELVYIKSTAGVFKLFDKLGYTRKAWQEGIRVVPRIYLSTIPKTWQKASRDLPVDEKKEIFFRLLAPAVLSVNESVLRERELLKGLEGKSALGHFDRVWLNALAEMYAVPKKARQDDKTMLEALMMRVDAVPVSLALAQSANESGWGTSRFAVLGNSLFGQWDFSNQGMKVKDHRQQLGTYTVAKFETPQDAVKAYVLNLNTNAAYAKFRKMRAAMRTKGEKLSGYVLAGALDHYSERGEAYVDDIRSMIRYNNLDATDTAYLWKKGDILLVPASESSR
jgi:Bax protein